MAEPADARCLRHAAAGAQDRPGAHDFVQAFGAPQVFLTWARRDGMEPAIPSRWILRLQTILKAAGHKPEDMPSEPWQAWAARLDQADMSASPHGKPHHGRRWMQAKTDQRQPG